MSVFHHAANLVKHYSSYLNYDLGKIYLNGRNNVKNNSMEHLEAAVQWICRAQDATADGGVARSYSLIYNLYFECSGWVASYPETTGYIIPTMFSYAHLTDRQDIFDRAIRMADWECDIQLASGAVQGGHIEQQARPAIFNTGQVIFGWVRAFQETGREKYLASAVKAGNFLKEHQDRDGAWRKELSLYASDHMPFYTYNTRTAWALLLLSTVSNDMRFKDAAIRNIEFALDQQIDNGWFKCNCLQYPLQPLLHTIAYCLQGILESGALLNNQTYINRAQKAADALMQKQRHDGSLPGRFDHTWEPTVSWSCLTGDAQMSIIWSRLYQITGESKYLDCIKKVNRYLKSAQLLKTHNPDIYGGISGSDPIHGRYGKFEILNWAVKFFIDALMLELSVHKPSGEQPFKDCNLRLVQFT
jgi:uncharacterized protein YyaL (SSP411 family)